MDKSSVIYLIKDFYTKDELGQHVPHTVARKVYCNIASVTGAEFFTAGQSGIQPQYRVTMFRFDYHHEETVNIGGSQVGGDVIGGMNYSVYRTYLRNTDEIELYLEKKAGS